MSKTTERVIRIKAEDDASVQIMNIARAFRQMATVIRQVEQFTRMLIFVQTGERISVMALEKAYWGLRIAKLAAIGFGVIGAVAAIAATAAMMTAGAGPMPVSMQTTAGTSRRVSATGIAVVHAGETVFKDGQGSGRGGGNINITIHSADMSYRAGIEETAQQLGTLIYQGYRRLRH